MRLGFWGSMVVAALGLQIHSYHRQIDALCQAKYPDRQRLRSIHGVGPITALAFVLTLENPRRFEKSREFGPALGLVPRRDQSDGQDPLLHIAKTGNTYLRRLLVGCAQYILGPFGPDCDLRRLGLQLADRMKECQVEICRGCYPEARRRDSPDPKDWR
ncbi:MAG: transposase [Anaerolineales bacterium]